MGVRDAQDCDAVDEQQGKEDVRAEDVPLDSMFHKEGTYEPLNDYVFGKNNNFEQGADSKVIKRINILHPPGVKEFYK